MTSAETLSQSLLLLAPVAPLLCLAGAIFIRRGSAGWLPWAALPGLVLALLPVGTIELQIPWLLFGGGLGLDPTGRVFLLLTALLWLAAGLYSQGYLADSRRRRRFQVFFLLCMSGNLGLPLATDLFSFYSFFVLMSLSAYGLVVHEETAFARRAGRIYLYLVLLGEVLLFTALLLAFQASRDPALTEVAAALAVAPTRHLIIGLLVAGLGIKLGMLPLHVWLPLAHPAAPIPASAVLSGAMIKAGLLGLMRMLPLGEATFTGWSMTLVGMGLVMAFFGVAVGLLQNQVKVLLAYSSISQMGLPLLALGLGLAHPDSWPLIAPAIGFYALHHGLAKGALFLGVGMGVASNAGTMPGIILMAGRILPALALAGVPLTSGAMAKNSLKPFLELTPLLSTSAMSALLALTTFGTLLLMARYLFLLRGEKTGERRSSRLMWSGWLMLLIGSGLCAGGAGWIDVGLPVWDSTVAGLTKIPWPLLWGGLAAGCCWRLRPLPLPLLPPGDLVLLPERMATWIGRRLARQRRTFAPFGRLHPPQGFSWHGLPLLQKLHQLEQALLRLSVAGVAFLLILVLLLLK